MNLREILETRFPGESTDHCINRFKLAQLTDAKIIRIVFKSASGALCSIDRAYDDRLTLTPERMTYKRTPFRPSFSNPIVSWSYKTSTFKYTRVFNRICSSAVKAMTEMPELLPPKDSACIDIIITFEDKTSVKDSTSRYNKSYANLFREVQALIPPAEEPPCAIVTYVEQDD